MEPYFPAISIVGFTLGGFPQLDRALSRYPTSRLAPSVLGMDFATTLTLGHDGACNAEHEPLLSVVLADDHALMRRGLRLLLERAEHIAVVGECSDLASTERTVDELRPRVLVLDLCMPDGSSFQAIDGLRTRFPGMQIVIVSMHDAPAFAEHTLAAGATGYVLKELSDEDLAPAILAAARGVTYISTPVADKLAALRRSSLTLA
jgi:AmiR/NasT family two-component response regulator